MPLSAQTGGAVDLIGKVTVTTPTDSIIFSPLSILADEAYRVEFDIAPDYAATPGLFPTAVIPQFNSIIVAGANLLEYYDYCFFGCTEFQPFDVFLNGVDWIIGSFTFRRVNVSGGQVTGLQNQQHWQTGGLVDAAFGSWQCTTTPIVDVTSVGVETSNGCDFFGVGTVVRLYKGSGE